MIYRFNLKLDKSQFLKLKITVIQQYIYMAKMIIRKKHQAQCRHNYYSINCNLFWKRNVESTIILSFYLNEHNLIFWLKNSNSKPVTLLTT